MRTIYAALFTLVMTMSCFSQLKDIDVYLSYSPELFIRLGMNYKFVGGYIKPCYSRNDKGTPYYTSVDRKGAEIGLNLNRKLFEVKNIELIANISGGFSINNVYIYASHASLRENAIVLAFIPEIRFMKKVSLTINPCYIYNFPEKNMNMVETTVGKMPPISVLETSFGLKLYW